MLAVYTAIEKEPKDIRSSDILEFQQKYGVRCIWMFGESPVNMLRLQPRYPDGEVQKLNSGLQGIREIGYSLRVLGVWNLNPKFPPILFL